MDDEPAPRSEASRGRPPVSRSNTNGHGGSPSTTNGGSRATSPLPGSRATSPLPGSRATSPLPQRTGTRRGSAREAALVRRLSMAEDIDTTFAAYFYRRERENAKINLTRETLLRDTRRVKTRVARAHRLLISPHGTLMQVLDLASIFALGFTATMSPYEIAFMPDNSSVVLYAINMVVIAVFAGGMIAAFFVPYREPLWKGGKVVRDHAKIAKAYLTGWFAIDLLATVPLDVIFTSIIDVDASGGGAISAVDLLDASGNGAIDDAGASSSNALRVTRMIRLVRLSRLIKLGRLLRATRIISRLVERAEKHSELLTISYTVRTAFFWMVVVLLSIHWFCCAWGIVALLQESQRTAALSASLSSECHAEYRAFLNTTSSITRACLIPCEAQALGALTARRESYVMNMEPWMCRRVSEGLCSGESSDEFYFHLLHNQGQMKNTGSKTGRVDENVLYFLISYLFLVLRTVFIGAISGARATSNPLGKAWQARMDHLNLFLKEMNAPTDLRMRTRQYLRNTRDLELKKSFNSLYKNFSKGLASEMMSIMSYSIVSGIYFFSRCEPQFLRDLATKMVYEAYERSERLAHTEPTLVIVTAGTLVQGGKPISGGQCVGVDTLVRSSALRDRRVVVALTYAEVCTLTRRDIFAAAAAHPESAKILRYEAFKIAMLRSSQLITQYMGVRGSKSINNALMDLGETDAARSEAHQYFKAINGGVKLRALAKEQQLSEDPQMAAKAKEAIEDACEDEPDPARAEQLADAVVINEDGDVVTEQDARGGEKGEAPHEQLAAQLTAEFSKQMKATRDELRAEMHEMRDEIVRQLLPGVVSVRQIRRRREASSKIVNGVSPNKDLQA